MEYQDYNDNFLRIRVEGYKKQVKRKIKNHDRAVRHFRIQKIEAETELESLKERLREIEIQKNELTQRFCDKQIIYENLVNYVISNNVEDEQLIGTLKLQEREILEIKHKLIEYDNERYTTNYQMKNLRINIYYLEDLIDKEKHIKSKIAIC